MIEIAREIQAEMVRHAQATSPIEACGYLAGIAGQVRELIPMQNADQSPEHFSFDPAEQFQAVKKARSKGLQLIAVYHSHPATPARMSEEDIRLANDPEMVYVIVSLQEEEPLIRGFRVATKQVNEVPITTGEEDSDG